MTKSKVTIVGGGRVGMTAAYTLLLRNTTRELVLFDRDVEKMRGEQLEFEDSLTFLAATKINAAQKNEDTRDSDVIVFTAGVAQQPGETRLELLHKNKQILESLLPGIIKCSPSATIIIVTNPVDILTLHASRLLALAKGQVFGTGTSLDSSRFRFHLSEYLGINPKSIHAYILGEHGDSSFPTISSGNVGGQPLLTLPNLSKELAQQAYIKAKNAAATIISAKGATYYAIAVVINQLVDAVLRDTRRVFPVSIPLVGEYGYHDVALSVPCIIGKNGVERILEIALSVEEKKMMDNSVRILQEAAQ